MSIRYHQLTLIERLPERWRNNVVGLWRCDCGAEKRLPMVRVKSGHAKSCGCLKLKHGGAARGGKTAEYVAWQAMHARCNATEGRDAKSYRARGITVCDRWKTFENFLADMGPRPSPEYSVDRENNNKGYEPDNCRWATPEQQLCNRRQSLIWRIKGRSFDSLRRAGAHFGVDPKTIHYWVRTEKEDCYVIRKY